MVEYKNTNIKYDPGRAFAIFYYIIKICKKIINFNIIKGGFTYSYYIFNCEFRMKIKIN